MKYLGVHRPQASSARLHGGPLGNFDNSRASRAISSYKSVVNINDGLRSVIMLFPSCLQRAKQMLFVLSLTLLILAKMRRLSDVGMLECRESCLKNHV